MSTKNVNENESVILSLLKVIAGIVGAFFLSQALSGTASVVFFVLGVVGIAVFSYFFTVICFGFVKSYLAKKSS